MSVEQSAIRNRLLALLAPDDFARLANHLEPIDLPRGFLASRANELLEHCYFHETGIASVVAISPEGHRAEVGLVGRDGLASAALVLGCDRTPFEHRVQVEGYGHRIERQALAEILANSPATLNLFLRFTHTLAVQACFTALSNANHQIDERLARWVLMCDDRSDRSSIALTHEFLSLMLAVRRPSVTTALHVLEGNGFIYSDRGSITIRNRAGLEAFASDAYGIPEREYERHIGPLR